jgi:hypothetical protein
VTELLKLAPFAGPVVAFVGAVLYAILRGHLVPRGTVDARVSEMQQVAVMWKDAAAANTQLVAEILPMVQQLVENDRVTVGLITGLKEAVNRLDPTPGRRDGERE